jgi:protein-L-isoaspartate(D-aspartate) O-methyltransferase
MTAEAENGGFAGERKRMVEHDLITRGISEAAVLSAMGGVPREEFMPESYKSQAYADCPLPIGMGQTISQPYIVALMTQELRLNNYCEVLEIGTGSGYQTAVLAKLARRVYTIERFAELSTSAQAILGRLGIKNVEFYIGDGSAGWPFFASSFAKATEDRDATKGRPEKRTFDRIVITASVPAIPQPVIDQLGEGGIIVAPVGGKGVQELVVGIKKEGKLIERSVCDVRFVRLIGKYAFKD